VKGVGYGLLVEIKLWIFNLSVLQLCFLYEGRQIFVGVGLRDGEIAVTFVLFLPCSGGGELLLSGGEEVIGRPVASRHF